MDVLSYDMVLIDEWDGTTTQIDIIIQGDKALLKYYDGTTHIVPRSYLAVLKARHWVGFLAGGSRSVLIS